MLDGLVRRRATASSGGLGRKQRFQNVRGAFRVAEKARPAIKGRNVILIDDVMTTGATAGACARALLRAGATSVHVLTWARALRSEEHTSELQSLMRISYAVFCLKKKKAKNILTAKKPIQR